MPRASTVRTLCLLAISLGLLILYVGVYVEQQCHDHVIIGRSPDQDVAMATRDVIVNNVTSSRRRAPAGYDPAPAAKASWDYNWDSYVAYDAIIADYCYLL